jgi:hypothetical protein
MVRLCGMNRPGVFVVGSRAVGADAAGTVGGRAALGGICFLCSQEQKQPMMKRDIPCLLCERWHLRIVRQGQGMRTVRSQRSSGADGIGCPCARSTRMPVDEPMMLSCSYTPAAGAASPGPCSSRCAISNSFAQPCGRANTLLGAHYFRFLPRPSRQVIRRPACAVPYCARRGHGNTLGKVRTCIR